MRYGIRYPSPDSHPWIPEHGIDSERGILSGPRRSAGIPFFERDGDVRSPFPIAVKNRKIQIGHDTLDESPWLMPDFSDSAGIAFRRRSSFDEF